MNERPIRLYPHEVRGIREGKQTQFRRAMQPQPEMLNSFQAIWKGEMANIHGDPAKYWKCPFGEAGTRLWVRETWGLEPTEHDWEKWVIYAADSEARRVGMAEDETAENWQVLGYEPRPWPGSMPKMRPSIHMPRWASRITLEVVNVRVERLQDISDLDALEEGIMSRKVSTGDARLPLQTVYGMGAENDWASTAEEAFEHLWTSINGPGSWEKNPWVRVVEFKQI